MRAKQCLSALSSPTKPTVAANLPLGNTRRCFRGEINSIWCRESTLCGHNSSLVVICVNFAFGCAVLFAMNYEYQTHSNRILILQLQ